jgi:ribosome biogenesis GTPase A
MWRGLVLRRLPWGASLDSSRRSFSRYESKFSKSEKPKNKSRSVRAEDAPSPAISWYPGHIAKAEKELADYIKLVDVVIEVRDARILSSTTHPLVSQWIGNRPVIVAISRIDQATKRSLVDWRTYYRLHPPYPSAKVFFLDGKRGDGIERIRRQILKASLPINDKRKRLGMEPRAVRAAVIGYPNVGKSSLINRILNRKLAPVQNVAGFTRRIKWVRVSDKNNLTQHNVIELLDSPGIIPTRMNDQKSALFLAICGDIGESAYDKHRAAVALCERVIALSQVRKGYVSIPSISARYKLSFDGDLTGEDLIALYAENNCNSEERAVAEKFLSDFRKGYWGLATLEHPPALDQIDAELRKKRPSTSIMLTAGTEDPDEFDDDSEEEGEGQEQGEVAEPSPSSAAQFSSAQSTQEPAVESKRREVRGASDSGAYDGW